MSLTWIKLVQPSNVEFSVVITASLYVRTPMNSRPTREATSPKIPRECSSQRLLKNKGQQEDTEADPLLCEEPSALCEG